MLEANLILLEKIRGDIKGEICEESKITRSVEIGEGSVIKNSIIRGPAIIGRNVHIENAYIGPFTSIGDDTKIVNAEVENSILMDEIRLEGSASVWKQVFSTVPMAKTLHKLVAASN